MPKIFIPKLGDIIELEDDWTFQLYDELRNDPVQKVCELYPPFRQLSGGMYDWRKLTLAERQEAIDKSDWTHIPYDETCTDLWGGNWHTPFTFRAGTRLKFDRYYIRQGKGEFDSVTFRTDCWVSQPGDPLFSRKFINGRKVKSLRFWAKLDDVNRIYGKQVAD